MKEMRNLTGADIICECLIEQGAVSYTHLDVYKRQTLPMTFIRTKAAAAR